MESTPGCSTRIYLTFAGFVVIYWIAGILHVFDEPARYPGFWLTVLGIFAFFKGMSSRTNEVDDVTLDRSMFAKQVLWALEDQKPPPPFSVFLRPFAADSRLLTHELGKSYGPSTVFLSRFVQFEELLANAVAKDFPLIGLGEDTDFPSGGRLRVRDAEWKETVMLLLQHATLIVIIPSQHEGTYWEACMLRDAGLLRTAVFIMPPRLVGGTSYPIADEWKTMRSMYVEAGIQIPEYSPSGALFRTVEGTVTGVGGILLSSEKLRQQIMAFVVAATSDPIDERPVTAVSDLESESVPPRELEGSDTPTQMSSVVAPTDA